ncbi:hypothetical protein CMUS01_12531, partial [Colletotrichum musicola]
QDLQQGRQLAAPVWEEGRAKKNGTNGEETNGKSS